MDRSIIYVMTEYGPLKAEATLEEKGLGEIEAGLISFVDARARTILIVSGNSDEGLMKIEYG